MERAGKVKKVMHEFKTGSLHSGSKSGPQVTSRKQAIAIAMSEAGVARKKFSDGGTVMASPSGGARGMGCAAKGKKFCGVR